MWSTQLMLLAVLTQAPESPPQRDARMAWWRDAQFGMFIHWGAYAVPAGTYDGERVAGIGEWIMSRAHIPIARYEEYVHRFNPVQFNPDEWVRIAKDAGMKYIIITSKHHDGFAIGPASSSGSTTRSWIGTTQTLRARTFPNTTRARGPTPTLAATSRRT